MTKPLALLTLAEASCGECSGANLNLILKTVPEATPMPTIPAEHPEDPLNIGATIVGGVSGGIAVVALVAVAIFIVLRRKTLFNHNTSSSGDFCNETASITE